MGAAKEQNRPEFLSIPQHDMPIYAAIPSETDCLKHYCQCTHLPGNQRALNNRIKRKYSKQHTTQIYSHLQIPNHDTALLFLRNESCHKTYKNAF